MTAAPVTASYCNCCCCWCYFHHKPALHQVWHIVSSSRLICFTSGLPGLCFFCLLRLYHCNISLYIYICTYIMCFIYWLLLERHFSYWHETPAALFFRDDSIFCKDECFWNGLVANVAFLGIHCVDPICALWILSINLSSCFHPSLQWMSDASGGFEMYLLLLFLSFVFHSVVPVWKQQQDMTGGSRKIHVSDGFPAVEGVSEGHRCAARSQRKQSETLDEW